MENYKKMVNGLCRLRSEDCGKGEIEDLIRVRDYTPQPPWLSTRYYKGQKETCEDDIASVEEHA